MSDERHVSQSHVGHIDDYDSEVEVSETNFDIGDDDLDPLDFPPGLADSSSEEELSDDGEFTDEQRIVDKVDFVGWRSDGWASLRVLDKTRSKGRKKRKVKAHDLSDLMRRRGPWSTAQRGERDGEEKSAEEGSRFAE